MQSSQISMLDMYIFLAWICGVLRSLCRTCTIWWHKYAEFSDLHAGHVSVVGVNMWSSQISMLDMYNYVAWICGVLRSPCWTCIISWHEYAEFSDLHVGHVSVVGVNMWSSQISMLDMYNFLAWICGALRSPCWTCIITWREYAELSDLHVGHV